MTVELKPVGDLRTRIERQLAPVGDTASSVASFLKEHANVFARSKAAPDIESDEITDPVEALNGLKIKADIMDDLIKKGQVEQYPIGAVRWALRRVWFANLVKDGGITGLGHLWNAMTQIGTKESRRIIFTPAHLSDLDHPAALHEMKQDRRGLSRQEEIAWMGGVNMIRRPGIKRFMRGGHVIYNVTPRDMTRLETLIDKKEEYGFDKEQIEELEGIKVTFNKMREAAKERVQETCEKEKKPLVFYPEGGRAYDGMLKASPGEFAWFIPRGRDNSAIIVPYRMYGTRELNPPGKPVKVLRWELVLFWRRQRISMVVGEPYSSLEVWEVYKTRKKEARQNADGKKVEINPMDWVMANIANIDPKYVKPDEQRYYGELLDRFAPGRRRFELPEEVTA